MTRFSGVRLDLRDIPGRISDVVDRGLPLEDGSLQLAAAQLFENHVRSYG